MLSNGYIPSHEDVKCLTPKSSITITTSSSFQQTYTYRLEDVGVQHTNIRILEPYLDGFIGMVFVLDLGSYDLIVPEKPDQIPFAKAWEMLNLIVKSKYLRNRGIILIFANTEVCQRKLQLSPFVDYFPEYASENDATSISSHILASLLQLDVDGRRIRAFLLKNYQGLAIHDILLATKSIVTDLSLRDIGVH